MTTKAYDTSDLVNTGGGGGGAPLDSPAFTGTVTATGDNGGVVELSNGNLTLSSPFDPLGGQLRLQDSKYIQYLGNSGNITTNVTLSETGSEVYLNSGKASLYSLGGGGHKLYTAASGSSGGVITWIPAVRVLDDGSVGLSTSTPTAKLDVNSNLVRVRSSKTPSSATDTGNQGDICWDSNYVYICVATNSWKRAALSTW
jgi:hypothetical protein